jgi:hypothetical protein
MDTKNKFLSKLKNYAFENQIPIWTYGSENAYLIVYVGILYTDIFSFLTSCIFEGDLCLHKSIEELDDEFNVLNLRDYQLEGFKFFNSGLNQKEYYIQYIPIYSTYGRFLESAVLYYLKFTIQNDKLPRFIDLFSGILTVNNTWTSLLYKDMVKLNIFSVFPLECLKGFFSYSGDFQIISCLVFKNPNDLFLVEKRCRKFRVINAFSFYFSPKFRSTCFKDCVETKSYIPMFLALKIYQIKLGNPDLTLNELKKVNLLSNFKEYLITHNSMSEKSIDKLIEKNWSYNYYE